MSWLAGLRWLWSSCPWPPLGLLAVRTDRAGRPAFVFLTWNLFLAWVPFVLSLGVAAVHGRGGPRPLLWVLGAGWLLFLPNAPYILTDFIHLGRAGGVPLWFDAALIGTFAATGLALGLASLLIVHHVVEASGRSRPRLDRRRELARCSARSGSTWGGSRASTPGTWSPTRSASSPSSLQRLADPFGNPFLLRFGVLMSILLLGSYLVAWILGRGILGPARGLTSTRS